MTKVTSESKDDRNRGFKNYLVHSHTHEETEPQDNVRQVVTVSEERTGQTSRRAVQCSRWWVSHCRVIHNQYEFQSRKVPSGDTGQHSQEIIRPGTGQHHPLTESDEEPALGTPGSQVFELGLNGIWGFSEPPACLGLLSLHNCVRQFQVAHGVYTLNVLGEYMNLEHLTYTSWDLGQAGKYSQASVL